MHIEKQTDTKSNRPMHKVRKIEKQTDRQIHKQTESQNVRETVKAKQQNDKMTE